MNMYHMVSQWLIFWPYLNAQKKKCLPGTLLVLIKSFLNGAIFCDMALFICLWGFDRQHLKNDANRGRQ